MSAKFVNPKPSSTKPVIDKDAVVIIENGKQVVKKKEPQHGL